jgi:hypothetical protein
MIRSAFPRSLRAFVLLALTTLATLAPLALAAQATKDLPLKYVGPATTAAITAGDLMTRLYKFADDSMMGRAVGTEYNNMGTAYIESEVRKFGLTPGGDNGTYFQNLPLYLRALDTTSTITVEGQTFKAGKDFLANSAGRTPNAMTGLPVIYLGTQFDTSIVPTADMVKGKVIVVRPFMPGPGFNQAAFVATASFKAWQAMAPLAAGAVTIIPAIPPQAVTAALNPTNVVFLNQPSARLSIQVTDAAAQAILGGPVANATAGSAGKPITSNIRFTDTPKQVGRNVVAILEGSDPKLKGQYVAIGAHNDHVGFNTRPAEHDSVKAFM